VPLAAESSRVAAFLSNVYPLPKVRRYVERASEPNPKRFFHYQIFLSERADDFFSDDFRNK
jgi:hypothetical protein